MNTDEAAACPGADEWAADEWAADGWTAIEARYRRAKEAMLDTQQHCDAAHEFLLARAQLREMLEAVFPGAEADSSQPISEVRCGCNRASA